MSKPAPRIDPRRPVELLHEHLTEAMCQAVFERERDGERDRIWGLHRLAEFWVAVILRAPASLTLALEEQCGRPAAGLPGPSSQGFFARCQSMRREFFQGVFESFMARVVAGRKPCFAREHAGVPARFAGLWVVDGSRLDAIPHRLKVLWKQRSVVLPGALVALYDLGHGVVRALGFDADAAASDALAIAEIMFDETERLNPEVRLKRPDVGSLRCARTILAAVRVVRRKGARRARRFCRARARWKSLRRISGAPRYLGGDVT